MTLTDAEVQAALSSAIEVTAIALASESEKKNNEVVVTRLTFLHLSLTSIKMMSKSSNGIPGLRGLGLEKALKLSEKITAEGIDVRSVSIHHGHIFDGITLD